MDDALDVMIGACEVANAPGHSATFFPRPFETFRDPCATENAARKNVNKASEMHGEAENSEYAMDSVVLFGNKK